MRSTESSQLRAAQEQFSRQAGLYAQSRPHALGSSLRLLALWAAPAATDRALDVATGAGFAAFAIAEQAAIVVASDLTSPMLYAARGLAAERGLSNVRFTRTAAEALAFPDGTFDLVTCRIAPHHFASVALFVNEVRRVLRRGGRFVLIDSSVPEDPVLDAWQQETERLRDPSHVRNWSPSEWRGLLEGSGFATLRESTDERTELVLSDWVRTSGSPPEVVALLERRFRGADEATRTAFRIREEDGDVAFSWMLFCALARAS